MMAVLAWAGIALLSATGCTRGPTEKVSKPEAEAAPAGPPLSTLLAEAERQWREGKSAESRRTLDEAIALYPRDEFFYRAPPLAPFVQGTRVEIISLWRRSELRGRDPYPLLNQARRLAVALKREDLIAKTDLRIANALVNEGKDAQAGTLYESVVTAEKKLGDQKMLVNALVGLSVARLHLDRLDETIALCLEISAILRQAPDPSTGARNENNLGWSYFKLGDAPRALEHLKLAATQYRGLTGGARGEIGVLRNLAAYYINQGNLAQAQGNLERAVEASANLEDEDRAPVLADRAEVEYLRHNLTLARESINKARNFSKSKGTGASHDDAHIRLVEAMIGDDGGDPSAGAAYLEVSNAAYARSEIRLEAGLLRARWLARHNRLEDAEAQYRASETLLDDIRNRLDQDTSKLSFFDDLTIYDEHVELLVNLNKDAEALIAADASRARLLLDRRGARSRPRLNLANVRNQLKAVNGVALFYWIGAKRGHLWMVNADQVKRLTLADSSKRIEALVAQYFNAVSNPGPLSDPVRTAGTRIREVLLDPVQKFVTSPGHDRPVFLVLDDKIGFNPESLPGTRTDWWLDEAVVSVIPSLALLERPHPATRATRKMLAIGDALASADFEKLLHAKDELDAIEDRFRAETADIFRREQATPARYTNSKPFQFEMIHFTAHGKAEARNPLDSAIILTKEPGTQSEKLYARTIADERIQARLVTISACKSAGARSYRGEGSVGLAWAFLGAGARKVVAGLWNVNDEVTPELMDKFYEGIMTKHQSPAVALRDAKKSLIKFYQTPYYWAPFEIFADSVEP